ncbi:MAG TPA: hypothetical protein VHO69_05950 [Phototrophicaceae bacterium]|nr:hypothetical protein [Phototrophicaceae bacterium]
MTTSLPSIHQLDAVTTNGHSSPRPANADRTPLPDLITVKGARLHNLKNISLQIPRHQFVVFTGLSGSGKSTLAFDTIHQEGQRQYLESLGLVTDYVQKPLVDSIEGLSPSISVDQHLTNRSPRSTVGTATEVFTYLRVLFARLGVRPCPNCGQPIPPPLDIDATLEADEAAESSSEDVYPCPHCGQPVPVLGMAHFSFNKPAGACPTCTGLGEVYDANLDLLLDPSQSIAGGGVVKWDRYEIARYGKAMQAAGKHYGFTFDITTPISTFGEVQRDLLLYGVNHPRFCRHFPNIEPPAATTCPPC